MAQWKSANITILENNTDSLKNVLYLIKFSTTPLTNLLEEISSYIDQTYPEDTWLRSSGFRSEREKIAKLDELKTETVTLRAELAMLKTPFILGLLEGFLNAIRQSILRY